MLVSLYSSQYGADMHSPRLSGYASGCSPTSPAVQRAIALACST